MPFAISSVLKDKNTFYSKKSSLSGMPTRIPQRASVEDICYRARFYVTVFCQPIHCFLDVSQPNPPNWEALPKELMSLPISERILMSLYF